MYVTLDHASLNTARLRTGLMTAGIFAAMVAVLYFCSSLVIGDDGLLVAAAVAVFLLALTANPPAGLVMRLSRAVPIPPRDARDLHAAVSELSRRAGLAVTPTLWWLPSPGINAFAAGHPDGAAIAVSDGAFRALSRHELVSVLAHEVAHVAAGDTRLMMIGSVLFRITQVFAMLGLIAATALLFLTGDADAAPAGLIMALGLATPAVALLYLALSRNREFAADLTAARLTGDAVGLARALERLERHRLDGGTLPHLLRTHPDTAERVNRLLGNVRLISPSPTFLYY